MTKKLKNKIKIIMGCKYGEFIHTFILFSLIPLVLCYSTKQVNLNFFFFLHILQLMKKLFPAPVPEENITSREDLSQDKNDLESSVDSSDENEEEAIKV